MRVVILDTGYESYDQEKEILRREGHRLDISDGPRDDTAGKLAFARDAAGILVRWSRMGAEEFDTMPALRSVVRYGVGYDNIDIAAASKRGIRVSNVQGYANDAVSDHALALILSCARGLPLAPRQVREGFGAPPRRRIPELKEMTLGIVGLGRIGGTLCTKVRGLFREVLACDPYVAEQRFAALGAERRTLATLVREIDVVSVHCNLTEETRGMFSAGMLETVRRGIILVNTARGPVVDEEALLAALESGAVHAAGLDVFEQEPPGARQDALLRHPHVICTGHYAWYSTASHRELQRRAASNMAAMLRGDTPPDCLNPETSGDTKSH